jgi:predicted glycosyltransferase
MILGLRDVIDECSRVREEWDRLSCWEHVTRTYDRVLVYGDPTVKSTAEELGLPSLLKERLRFTGYLAPRPPMIASETVPNRALAMLGGGGDGMRLALATIEALSLLKSPLPERLVLLLGPFYPEADEQRLRALARSLNVAPDIRRFDPGVRSLIEESTQFIAMGGYNSIVEVLALGRPVLVLPRKWPRLEQTIRAQRLKSRVPFLQIANDDEHLAQRIATFLDDTPAQAGPPFKSDLDLNGLNVIAAEVESLLKQRSEADRGPAPHNRSESLDARRLHP